MAGTLGRRIRQVEARSDTTAPVSAGSPIPLTRAFHACAGLVFANASRERKMAMAQLPGQSTLRRAEPVPVFHGEHAPAAKPGRLRVLPDALGCVAEKIRPASRQPQSSRTK